MANPTMKQRCEHGILDGSIPPCHFCKHEQTALELLLSNQQAAQLRDERDRLRRALKIIAEGTLCPELFPDMTLSDETVWEIQAKTAVVSAIAALEPR